MVKNKIDLVQALQELRALQKKEETDRKMPKITTTVVMTYKSNKEEPT